MSNRKILIVGHKGFLGSYIYNEINKLYDVILLDMPEHDIRDLSGLAKYMIIEKPDLVIHLAALCGAAESDSNPYLFIQTNSVGTLNILEACKQAEVSKLIFTSSLTVFGSCHNDFPVTENAPKNARHVYATSKIISEILIEEYSRLYGLKSIILRPTLTVGPGCKELHAIGDFIRTARKGQQIKLFGSGDHIRDFIHPIDVLEGVKKAIELVLDCEYVGTQSFNLSSGEGWKIKDLANYISSIYGANIEIGDETKQTFSLYTSIEKAQKILNWQPKYMVSQIIDEMVERRN